MFDLFHDSAYDETLFLSRMDSTEGKQVRCDIAHTEQQPMAAAQDGGVSGLWKSLKNKLEVMTQFS